MNRMVYWLSYLIGDLLMFVLPLIALFISIVAFNVKSLNMSASLCLIFMAFILHVPGNVLFAYTFSFITKNWRMLEYWSWLTLVMVSLFCNKITFNIVSYLILDPWGNSNFYFSSWCTISFTAWGMPFFFSFLLDVRSELTHRSEFLIFDIFSNDNCWCYNFLETNTTKRAQYRIFSQRRGQDPHKHLRWEVLQQCLSGKLLLKSSPS